MEIKRGDIFFANIPPTTENVQFGVRPILIISNDKANYFSPVITYCPISSTKGKREMKTHVAIELDQPSFIICEQIMTINTKNLFRFVCSLDDEKMCEVDKALDIQLQKSVILKNDNEIEIYQKAQRMAKSIEFLEDFIYKKGKSQEIINSLYIQVIELQDYCKAHKIDIGKVYISKLGKSLDVKVG